MAEPSDVQTFVKLQKWLSSVQKELDLSWASLGEVYGLQQHNSKNKFGIRIRRIRSNIDDIEAFAETVNYVPQQLSFETSNAELLKLLVGPLYGNNPEIGIRELLQNALDAVRELKDFGTRENASIPDDLVEITGDVELKVVYDEKGEPAEIVVSDRGVGMDIDVLKNYFLRAGASFRKSDSWRTSHEDQQGHSRVLRTGRFGVGALAAFLLGDEMQVVTRSFRKPRDQALSFQASLSNEAIEIQYVSAPVGTVIRVPLNTRSKNQLSGWSGIPPRSSSSAKIGFSHRLGIYFLDDPKLSRVFDDGKIPCTVERLLPAENAAELTPWRKLSAVDFGTVFWTYSTDWPDLASNGIIIGGRTASSRASLPARNAVLENEKGFPFARCHCPKLSVFDRDGRLPVNLARDSLSSSLPFTQELYLDVFDDVIAHALVNAAAIPRLNVGHWTHVSRIVGGYWDRVRSGIWFLSSTGFSPALCSLSSWRGGYTLVRLTIGTSYSDSESVECDDGQIVLIENATDISAVSVKMKGIFRAACERVVDSSQDYLVKCIGRPTGLLVSDASLDTIRGLSPGVISAS